MKVSEVAFVIDQDESLSAAVHFGDNTVVGIRMPAAWTTADISFVVSSRDAAYLPLYYDGAEVTIAAPAADTIHAIDPVKMLPGSFVQVRSGSAASPVAQTAGRTGYLIVRQV